MGCASHAPDLGITVSRCMDGRASIFTMESVALRDAVIMVIRFPGRNAFIVSDSLSALIALCSQGMG